MLEETILQPEIKIFRGFAEVMCFFNEDLPEIIEEVSGKCVNTHVITYRNAGHHRKNGMLQTHKRGLAITLVAGGSEGTVSASRANEINERLARSRLSDLFANNTRSQNEGAFLGKALQITLADFPKGKSSARRLVCVYVGETGKQHMLEALKSLREDNPTAIIIGMTCTCVNVDELASWSDGLFNYLVQGEACGMEEEMSNFINHLVDRFCPKTS